MMTADKTKARLWRMAVVLLRLDSRSAMPLNQQPASVQADYLAAAKRVLQVADATR
jgi:hypothetical protein